MNEQEYRDKKLALEKSIQEYINLLDNIETEYRFKMTSDPRWVTYSTLRDQKKFELQRIKEQWYDDNRVYRTGERYLATRMDCTTGQDKACIHF